jgi:RNA polymerase sigma-70 factor (ECF subfamily)
MQCPTISDVLPTEPTETAGETTHDDGMVRSWTRRIASAVGLRDNIAPPLAREGGWHDTPQGVWDTNRSADVVAAPGDIDEAGSELADALRAGEPFAVGRLFDLYGKHVERVLVRTVGRDGEMDDMVQDVFLGAYRSGRNYQGNDAQLKAWVSRIAVFTARGYLRKRKRRWWLRPADPKEIPEQTSHEPSPHTQEVLRRTYLALDGMDPDLRIPLALRELESMELAEIAEACDCSVSTVKRRLARARKVFERIAKKDPILRDWLEDEK